LDKTLGGTQKWFEDGKKKFLCPYPEESSSFPSNQKILRCCHIVALLPPKKYQQHLYTAVKRIYYHKTFESTVSQHEVALIWLKHEKLKRLPCCWGYQAK
jgi:hypothetical protein